MKTIWEVEIKRNPDKTVRIIDIKGLSLKDMPNEYGADVTRERIYLDNSQNCFYRMPREKWDRREAVHFLRIGQELSLREWLLKKDVLEEESNIIMKHLTTKYIGKKQVNKINEEEIKYSIEKHYFGKKPPNITEEIPISYFLNKGKDLRYSDLQLLDREIEKGNNQKNILTYIDNHPLYQFSDNIYRWYSWKERNLITFFKKFSTIIYLDFDTIRKLNDGFAKHGLFLDHPTPEEKDEYILKEVNTTKEKRT